MIARPHSHGSGQPSYGNILLTVFLEDMFLPRFRPDCSANSRVKYRTAIKWLSRSLATPPREPQLRDLNRGLLTAFFAALADSANLSRGRIIEIRKRLLTLWKHAALLGFASRFDPPPLGQGGKVRRRWNKKRPPDDSLLRYYRELFRPAMVPRVLPETVSDHDRAINAFHDFVGSAVLLRDVTPLDLKGFRKWLGRNGYRVAKVRYAGCILRIM